MEKTKKIELNYESFYRLKEMLSSNDIEDVNLALKTLSNMDIDNVYMVLLAKSISKENRSLLHKTKKFANKFYIDGVLIANYEWNNLFPLLIKQINFNSETGLLQKKILEELFSNLIKKHLLYDGYYNIIKNMTLELNYE